MTVSSVGRTDSGPPIAKKATGDPSATGESFGFDLPEDAWLSRLKRASTPANLGRLGDYELLAEIGRGSQGVVFKAVQPHTRRTVALKRLGAGSLATASMRSRFEREVEAACLLDHPGIVTVHGVEMLDGQPVLAMEWVEGQPIDAWAGWPETRGREPGHAPGAPDRDASRAVALPARPRPLAEMLTVFALACDAVAHAHRRGVLHRDLKPSNVLVDAGGRARVLDFGLAKLLPGASAWEETSLTRPGGFLGTPAYAPPEALHDPDSIDTRSDIYALGIILYRILAGVLPFQGARGVAGLFDQVRRGVTRPPSAHRAVIGRELDAITLKATALEPDRRYATADDLAADVRRYLAGDTVAALPPSRAYLARKFVRRHRAPVALALGVFLMTVTLAATATTYSFRLSHKSGRLEASLKSERAAVARAVTARNRAEASDRESSAALSRARRQALRHTAVAELLGLLWAQAADNPHADADMRAAIDRAIATLAARKPGDRPAPAALVRRSLGEVLQTEGLFTQAAEQARESIRLATEVDGPESRPTAMALVTLGQNLALMGRLADAEAPLREAERLRHVNNPTEAGGVVAAMSELGTVLIEQGRAPEAEALFRRALQARTDPGDRVTAPVVPLHRGLGAALLEQGRCSEAEVETRKALDAPRDYATWEPDHAARTHRNLARILYTRGRLEEAEKEMHGAMNEWAALLAPDHPQMARESLYLAAILAERGNTDDALAVYTSAIERMGRRLPADHPWLTQARLGQARVLAMQGDYAQSQALLRETLAHALTTPPGSEVLAADAAEALAESLRASGRGEEAAECLADTADQLMPRLPPEHPLTTRLAAWPRPDR